MARLSAWRVSRVFSSRRWRGRAASRCGRLRDRV